MKIKIIVLACILLVSFSAVSQNACSTYYPFKAGIEFEITNFNKKGKKESIVNYKVLNIENNEATIEIKVLDEKGKEISTATYKAICNDDAISIDFKSLISPEIYEQYKDMDLDITGTNIEIPNDLQVGKSLKDANLNMVINMSGIKMNMTIDMVNRKVNSKESITTAAGTFDCYVLSYNTEMKMGMKISSKIKEWIAEGIGVVKSENYNKKGKLVSYSELTKFSN